MKRSRSHFEHDPEDDLVSTFFSLPWSTRYNQFESRCSSEQRKRICFLMRSEEREALVVLARLNEWETLAYLRDDKKWDITPILSVACKRDHIRFLQDWCAKDPSITPKFICDKILTQEALFSSMPTVPNHCLEYFTEQLSTLELEQLFLSSAATRSFSFFLWKNIIKRKDYSLARLRRTERPLLVEDHVLFLVNSPRHKNTNAASCLLLHHRKFTEEEWSLFGDMIEMLGLQPCPNLLGKDRFSIEYVNFTDRRKKEVDFRMLCHVLSLEGMITNLSEIVNDYLYEMG